MAFLKELSNSKKSKKLKKTKTQVRTRDGKVFEEKKTQDGYELEFKKKEKIPEYLQEKKQDINEIKKHQKFVESFNIEKWYPIIKDLTFDTYFISINTNMANIFINTFKEYHLLKSKNELKPKYFNELITKNKQLFSIKQKMDDILKKIDPQNNGVFSKVLF